MVYHSSLTDEQDEELDRLQASALKCIFGPRISARKLCELADIMTLRRRREELCMKFANKCVVNPRMKHLFPLKTRRTSGRLKGDKYLETKVRCDRLKNSPVFYFRRILNGKPGRSYGKRYEEYRSSPQWGFGTDPRARLFLSFSHSFFAGIIISLINC